MLKEGKMIVLLPETEQFMRPGILL